MSLLYSVNQYTEYLKKISINCSTIGHITWTFETSELGRWEFRLHGGGGGRGNISKYPEMQMPKRTFIYCSKVRSLPGEIYTLHTECCRMSGLETVTLGPQLSEIITSLCLCHLQCVIYSPWLCYSTWPTYTPCLSNSSSLSYSLCLSYTSCLFSVQHAMTELHHKPKLFHMT